MLLAVYASAIAGVRANGQVPGLIAINVVLEPDETMLARAAADNARLRTDHPTGFVLDSTRTHITLLQAFVEAADMPRVQEVAARALHAADSSPWRLTATGRTYLATNEMGLSGIAIRPTPALLRLQEELVEAIVPFAKPGADVAAFAGMGAPEIDASTIAYIEGSVRGQTGGNFSPRATTGIAQEYFVRAMVAKPFAEFEFGPTGAAILHLNIFSTAHDGPGPEARAARSNGAAP